MTFSWVTGVDKRGDAIYSARTIKRTLQFRVTHRVHGETTICGYTGFLPPIGVHGNFPVPLPEVFLVRNGCLFTEPDLPSVVFARWQDRLCGPDWVKPLPMPPLPS